MALPLVNIPVAGPVFRTSPPVRGFTAELDPEVPVVPEAGSLIFAKARLPDVELPFRIAAGASHFGDDVTN
jgi:hypothetical protein